MTCAVKMPLHPQHPGLYKFGTVAVGQGRQMDGAAYVRAILGDDGRLRPFGLTAVRLDECRRSVGLPSIMLSALAGGVYMGWSLGRVAAPAT